MLSILSRTWILWAWSKYSIVFIHRNIHTIQNNNNKHVILGELSFSFFVLMERNLISEKLILIVRKIMNFSNSLSVNMKKNWKLKKINVYKNGCTNLSVSNSSKVIELIFEFQQALELNQTSSNAITEEPVTMEPLLI